MYVGLKQPLGDGERCVTPARAAAKETMKCVVPRIIIKSLEMYITINITQERTYIIRMKY